jgi:hypothetical protein
LTKAPKIYDKTASSTNVSGKNCVSACRKLKLDPCFTCTSIKSKWINDLNRRPETLRLVQERAGKTLEAIGIDNDFLNITQMVQQLRDGTDKWDYMKLKKLLCNKRIRF